MTSVPWLPERLNRWLTVAQPVTYWSFWAALLRLVPLLVVPFVVVFVAVGGGFALRSFAPVPFVFVAATLGYAVRAFDELGVLLSLIVAAVYGFLLWASGVGMAVLRQPTPLLSVLAVLAFVALVAGFSAPTLHGQRGEGGLERARRKWQEE
jgi:hypothetical protein